MELGWNFNTTFLFLKHAHPKGVHRCCNQSSMDVSHPVRMSVAGEEVRESS